jgi:hypothetical protein
MVVVTIRVPEDLKERMNRHDDVNWSEVARSAFEAAILREERMKAIEEISSILETDGSDWDGVEEIRKWRAHRQ